MPMTVMRSIAAQTAGVSSDEFAARWKPARDEPVEATSSPITAPVTA